MQNLFQNKNITQKIIIALVIVILFNFMCPKVVQAADFNFIYQAISWLLVRGTDCIQWIMLVALTGDASNVMARHVEWSSSLERWK